MKKNFTRLISGLTQSKKFVIALTSLVILASSVYLYADILAITPQDVSVSADKAVGGIQAGFTEVPPIVFQEGDAKDFNLGSGNFVITAPAGWAFRPSDTRIIASAIGSTQASNIIANNAIYNSSTVPTVITVPFTVTGQNRLDRITIEGLALQAQVGTVLPARNVTLSISGALVTGFASPTTIATIAQTHGAPQKLAFTRQPGNALINSNLSSQPRIAVQDFFGNTVTSGDASSSTITLAIGANPNNGTLGGTTTLAAVNGIASFAGIRINRAGEGYTLIASGAGFTVTSNPFTINNRQPTVTAVSCLSEGNPATVATLTGTNFADGATVLVNGVSREANIIGTTSLTTTLTAAELSTPGNLEIVVKNVLSTEGQNNGESATFTAPILPLLLSEDITGNAIVCGNTIGVVYSIPAVAGAKSYAWTIKSGDATIATAGSTTNSITVNFGNTSGTVRLGVKVLNQCDKAGAEKTYDITLNALPVVTLEPFAAVCKNTPTFALTGGSPAGGTYSIGGEAITAFDPATAAVGNHTVTYTYEDPATSCVNTATQIIRVNAVPTAEITDGPNDYFCPTGTATLIARTGTGYEYTWYRVVEGGDDVVLEGDGNKLTTNVVGYYYVVVQDGNSCSSTSPQTFVQQSILDNNIISGAQEVCYGAVPGTFQGSEATSDVGNVTYQWQVSSDGVAFSNVTSTQSGGTATLQDLSLTIALTQNRWYRRIARVGSSCSITSQPIEVKVKQQIANTLTSGNQTVCLNNPAQTITGNPVTGGDGPTSYTYTWYQRTGTGDWEAASGINNQESYTPEVSATVGTYSFRRDVVSGSCAPIVSNAVTITVQPAITGNVIGGTGIYCLNAAATNLGTVGGTLSGGAGSGYTYSWQERVGENGTWATIIGATSSTYRPLTTTAGDFYYKRIANSGACIGAESNEFKVTVQPAIVNNLTGPDSYSYCQNTTAIEIGGNVSGGDGTNYTYLWQRSANGTTSWSAAAGVNDQPTYTPVITASGTSYYRRTVISGVCAVVPSNVIVVTVIPAIANNTLGGASSICFNSQPALVTGTLPTNGNGEYAYLWEQSTDGGATWVAAVGTNNEQNYQPPVLTVTTQYRRTVNAGTCLPNVSAPRTVTVTPLPAKPVISNLTKSVYYSGETAFNLSVSPTHSSGRFIYERRNDATGNFTEVSRVQSASFSPCSLTPGTYRISYTYTPGCTNTSDPITVTIRRSEYRVVIEAAPFPTCRGQNTTYRAVVYRDVQSILYPYLTNAQGQPIDQDGNLLAAKAYPIPNPAYPFPADAPQILKDNAYRYYQPIVTGGIRVNDGAKENDFTYRWTKNFDNYPFGNTAQAGNAGLSSEDYYAVSVYTNANISGNSCIDAIPQSSPLWANRTYTAAPINYEVKLETDKATICEGGSITMSANLDAAFAFWKDIELTLYWMVERPGVTNPIELGSTKYTTGNQVSFTTTGPNGTFQNGDKVFVEFSSVIDKQNDVNSKCSRGFTTNQVAITVVGTQTMSGGGAYCAGGAGIPVGINGSQQGVLYQLLIDGQPVGSPVAGTGSALSFGNQTTSGAYSVQALSAAGETPCLTYGPVNVFVTPLPVMQTLTAGSNGEYCVGGIGVPITLGGSQTGVSYQLVRTVGGTSTNIGQARIGNEQPIEFGNQTETGVYSVLATTLPATGTIAACPQTMGSVTVTINPLPTVNVNSPTICEGSTATVTAVPTGGTGPYTYTWTVPTGANNPGNVASFQTTIPGTYTVSIEDSKSCASSAAATSTVIVNELPTVTVNSSTVCAGTDATVTATPDGGVGPFTYTWTVPAGADNPGDVASFQTKVAGNYSVRIQDSRSCSSSQAATGIVTLTPMKFVEGNITAENERGPITTNNPIGAGEKVTFTATVPMPAADISGYVWHKGSMAANSWTVVQSNLSNTYEMVPGSEEPFDLWVQVLTPEGVCYLPINIFNDEPIIPLPVELLYFNATKRGSDVVLDWATASEQDNKGFEVQVSSDARNFRTLGFVESRVNTTSLKQLYAFVDKENGKHGTRYYRLKQVDLDGKFEYFSIKAVSFGSVEANKVKAYPNPFHSEIELSIDAELDGDLLITVTNATGQQLLQRTVKVARGTNTEKLVLDPNLPRGVYIISTRMGDFNNHFKLLKQ